MININKLSDLLYKIVEGDHEAFHEFYDKTNSFVFHVALSYLCNYNDANDVSQNVYIKIFSLRRDLVPEFNTMQWLRSVVKNECYSFIRKNHDTKNIDEYADVLHTPDFEEKILDNESFEYHLRSLSQDEREIILLKIVGCRSHNEIAKILGKPPGTIRWMYRQALKKFERNMLDHEQNNSEKNKE